MSHKRPNQDDGSVPAKSPEKSKIEVAYKQIQKKFTIQKCSSHEITNKQAQSSELPINKNVTPTSHDAKEEKQKEVKFMELRNLINGHFAKVMEALRLKVCIDTTINQVLHDVNNLNESHCKDKEGDTVLEPNVVTHLHDTSNIVQDSDTKHMNVIFYYLRKKGKYHENENFRYTTVDCIFMTQIEEIYDKYAHQDGDTSVAKEEDVICDYIKGYRLIANVS
ncbi:hypothetical protein HAX54_021528 [Datura stramonium]|uniref:Uncharacterized protein n=1 Tax=Datura stramonium TaxID=4076 RepID=A0ABS8S3E5_DATST|nr:hypothetical protein [Datura stramonium]